MKNNLEIRLSKEKKKIQSILLEICKEIATEKIFGNIETHFEENVINLIRKIQDGQITSKTTLGGCFIEKVNETILISREND